MSFRSLIESMNSTSCLTLQRTINAFIQNRLPSRNVFIMFLSELANECVIQVVGDDVLEKELRFSIEKKINLRSVQEVEKENDLINFWLREIFISKLFPYMENFLKVPIRHPENESVVFYVCLIDPTYTFENDEYNFSTTVTRSLDICSAILLNAFLAREAKQMNILYQKLRAIERLCLMKAGDYNQILTEMLIEARTLTNTERCSLFVLSRDKKMAKVYDGERTTQPKPTELLIDHGIVGYVATCGETVLIENAQSHPLMAKNTEIIPGFKARNLLCFPVLDQSRHIVGVGTLCNKRENSNFTFWDEKATGALGLYLGIALANGILHREIQINKARDVLSLELITHHLTKRDRDFEKIMNCKKRHHFEEMLDFRWIPRSIRYSDTTCYVIRMFDHLGLTVMWKIPRTTLVSFAVGVRRGYRDLPYHNWEHGFSVAQFAYLLMHELKLMRNILITGLEAVAFLVSALCHDLDHRGTTNGFQILSGSSLALLYGSEGSVMERHHFSHTLTLLNTEHCNIFQNLTVEQYTRVISLIRDMILATDLAEYVKALPEERNMSIKGYNPEKKAHRSLLLSLMMTCCDLNDQLKGWLHCRNIADQIYSEFFHQGDMEKEMGNEPLPSMDREKAFIPELQLEFLTAICMPCFTVLSNIFPQMKCCIDSIEDTFRRWQGAIEWVTINGISKTSFLKHIYDPSLEAYVLDL